MKTDKRKRGSMFFMFLCNYIVFTIILILGIFLLFVIGAIRLGDIIENTARHGDFLDYADELSVGAYDQLPLDWLLGIDGYIEIIDSDNTPVYQSNTQIVAEQYTKEELSYIPSYQSVNITDIRQVTGDDGEKVNVVVVTEYNQDYVAQKEVCYVLDQELNILLSTNSKDGQQLTEREYQLLTDNWASGYSVRKQPFVSKTGEDFTLITYSPPVGDENVFHLFRAVKEVFWEFVVLYILLIGLFILWLNRKISKPLSLLNRAILDFSGGKREQYVEYKGPKEFVEICESFNHMAQDLYQTEQEKERLEQEKQRMLADISHDLKTPITVIKGYSEAICDGIVTEEEKPQYLATIYQKADSLTDLIDTFYEYSKMEHPNYNLVLEKLDICTYLRNYLAEKYNELYLAGFQLEVDIPEEPLFCGGDQVQLRRALENLVVNALRHNEPETTIFCTLTQQKDSVRIVLADDGVGIQAELAELIFDPFIVGEASRTKHGSGLGLAVSRRIIEAHGGSICLVMPPENGYHTEFEIVLQLLSSEG